MAYPSRNNQTTRRAGGARRLLCCLIALVVTIVVIVGLVILIFWLIVRPKPVEYYVDGASIHDFNISSSDALNATFDFALVADNRNRKVSVYYDEFEVTVWYDGEMIAFNNVDPFYQPKRNITKLDVHPQAKATPLLTSVAKDLKHDRSSGGVQLEVRIRSKIRFKVGMAKTKHYTLRAYCPVDLKFASSTFERAYCDVDI